MCIRSLLQKFTLCIIATGLCLYALPLFAADKNTPQSSSNNNAIIALQNRGGNPAQAGKVTLEYFGHMAFRISSPQGLTLLIDPWKNDPSGTWGIWFPKEFPLTTADIAASTHGHYDHNALHRVKAHMQFDRMAGQWSLADLKISGIADKHQYQAPGPVMWTDLFAERGIDPVPPNNPPILDNTIFIIETGGLRIVHWGDNRPDAPDAVFAAIGQPDVLILPIDDSTHVLSKEQIQKIITRLNPHIIIPAHYLIKGVSSVASTLLPADTWVNSQTQIQLPAKASVVLDPANVKKRKGEVLYFEQNAFKP